ncbi:MAG: alpha/beta hydrolase family protein [Chloroflexi bacterium]|nr:alpha/beta hydrolase family protein [Chloroflexota bacterium]
MPESNFEEVNPYSYSGGCPFDLRLKEETRRWRRYAVAFPTAFPSRYFGDSQAYGEYFVPRQGHNGSLAILVHGWGDRSLIPCRFLARSLVKQGFACFVLYLVFHTVRIPAFVKDRLSRLTDDEWFEIYRISVTDIRSIVDWATSHERIDREKIALVGISLGGIFSVITMGVEARVKAGVFLVSGGNYTLPAWYRRLDHQPLDFAAARKQYARYLSEVAEKGFDHIIPPQRGYLTDPMTFARYLRRRPVLMINARWDEAIPRQGTVDLWRASGEPPIIWLPATHASIWCAYPYIRRKISRFLSATIGAPPGNQG